MPSGYSLFTNCSFDSTKNKLVCYRGTGCMERFYKGFKRAYNKNNQLWKKKMMQLTDKENKSYEKRKVWYICKNGFSIALNKNYQKVTHPACDVVATSHFCWDVADHIETSSRRRYWYVNKSDLFGTLSRRLTVT